MKFKIVFPISVMNCVGISMRIAMNLLMAFGRLAIFTLSFLTHEQGRLSPSSGSFVKSLKFSLFKSFISFIRFVLRY